jgi:ATP-binding cassette, subfamily B, bacterial
MTKVVAVPPTASTSAARRFSARLDGSVGATRVLRDAVRAIGPERLSLGVLCGLSVVSGLLESILLYLVARLALGTTAGTDEIAIEIGPISTPPLTTATVVALAGGFLLAWIAVGYPVSRLASRLGAQTLVRLRTTLLEAYVGAPWSEVSKDREGRLQELAGEYCQRSERLVQLATTIIVTGLNIAVILTVAIIIAPIGAVASIVGLGTLGVLLRPLSKRVRGGAKDYADASRQFNSRVAQTARVAQEMAAFDAGDEVVEWLSPDIEAAASSIERLRFAAVFMPMLYQFGALAMVIVLAGVISVTDPSNIVLLAPVLLLLIRVLGYGRQMQNAIQAGIELTPFIDGLLSEVERLVGSHEPPRSGTVPNPVPLSFRDVSFAYRPGEDVLQDVSFTIQPGDTVGIVGPSGGGKSTLTQLLLKLRVPTGGSIVSDGMPLVEIGAPRWAEMVALVPQDNKLVHGTVADNVRFFRTGFSQADVETAVRAAHLHDEVLALPDGYETVVGPGAQDLSGGQRQRLGIARGLVGRPQLLILDEPTSALDSRSEQLIRQTLEELAASTTLIVIAHRPATLEICTRLFIVDHGTLTEGDQTAYHGSLGA